MPAGLVSGKGATRFEPYSPATRGYVAKILYNTLNIQPTLFMGGQTASVRSWAPVAERSWFSPAESALR